MGILQGEDYLNSLVEGNQELFQEVLDRPAAGLNNLALINACIQIARSNFVNEAVVGEFVKKCEYRQIDSDFMRPEIERVFCQNVKKIYREVLIGNILYWLRSKTVQEVIKRLLNDVQKLRGGNAIGFIGTLELDKRITMEEIKCLNT